MTNASIMKMIVSKEVKAMEKKRMMGKLAVIRSSRFHHGKSALSSSSSFVVAVVEVLLGWKADRRRSTREEA